MESKTVTHSSADDVPFRGDDAPWKTMSAWVQSKHGDWVISLEFGQYHEEKVRAIFEGIASTIQVKANKAWVVINEREFSRNFYPNQYGE